MSEAVVTTLIAGGFTVVVALIGLLSRANRRDHLVNGSKLDRLLEATDNLKAGHKRIETKIDSHIDNHAKGMYE